MYTCTYTHTHSHTATPPQPATPPVSGKKKPSRKKSKKKSKPLVKNEEPVHVTLAPPTPAIYLSDSADSLEFHDAQSELPGERLSTCAYLGTVATRHA